MFMLWFVEDVKCHSVAQTPVPAGKTCAPVDSSPSFLLEIRSLINHCSATNSRTVFPPCPLVFHTTRSLYFNLGRHDYLSELILSFTVSNVCSAEQPAETKQAARCHVTTPLHLRTQGEEVKMNKWRTLGSRRGSVTLSRLTCCTTAAALMCCWSDFILVEARCWAQKQHVTCSKVLLWTHCLQFE